MIVALAPWTALRAAAGVLLAGVVPGALVSYASLPPASRIDGRLRVVLALSLSVAIDLFLGLSLALISDHISHVAVGVGLGVALTVAGAIAFLRDDGSTELSLPRGPAVAPAVAIVTGLLAVVAIASVVAALNVDSLPTQFTALALTKAEGGVRLSITSHENQPTRYRYVLSDGSGMRLYSSAVRVEPDADAEVLLPVPPGTGLVRAQLFKGAGSVPYRSADLRLPAGRETTSATAP